MSARNGVDGSLITEIDPKHHHFSWKTFIEDGLGVPCSVVVEQGDVSLLVDVKNAPENCGRKLTLTGRVIDEAIPFAIVQFTIGDQVYSTVADENGFYQIDITTSTTDDLVVAEATVPGSTELTLTSIIGPVSSLLSDENANGVIDSSGTFSTDITNVTTANVVLMTQANGGEPITNLAQLEQAEKFVDATELLQLAAVIKLILDDPGFDIPVGYDNLLEFTSDSLAVTAFVETVDPTIFEDTLLAIITDADLLPGFEASDIPSKYYAIVTPVVGFLARSGDALEFDPAGTGNLLTTDVDGRPINDAYNWQVDDGVLSLNFVAPTSQVSFPGIEQTTATPQQINDVNSCNNHSVIERITEIGRDIVLIQNGVLEEKVSLIRQIHTTYDPIDIDDGCDGSFDRVIQLADKFENRSQQGSLRDSSQISPIDFVAEAALVGSWVFNFDYDLGESAFTGPIGEGLANDLLTFNSDGTGTAKIANTAFDWSENGDVLTLSYLSPANESLTEQIVLLDLLDGVYGAFYELTNNDTGERVGTYGLAVKQDPSFAFSLPLLQTAGGNFWNSGLNAQLKNQYDADGQLLFTSHFG